jgi:L-fuculose-phosphate aldolase
MLESERQTVAKQVSALQRLTPGRTGNLSVRQGDRIAITPSGVPYDEIDAGDVPVVSLDGEQLSAPFQPSSETPMHRHIYRQFDAGAIVHVHSPWATTLSVLRQPLPPVHYMIALAGERIPVAEYATYGTEALASNVVEAMESANSDACLLANHGLVVTGADAENAIELTEVIESIARVYCQASAFGTPEVLSAEEIEETAEKLDSYGPGDGDSGEH